MPLKPLARTLMRSARIIRIRWMGRQSPTPAAWDRIKFNCSWLRKNSKKETVLDKWAFFLHFSCIDCVDCCDPIVVLSRGRLIDYFFSNIVRPIDWLIDCWWDERHVAWSIDWLIDFFRGGKSTEANGISLRVPVLYWSVAHPYSRSSLEMTVLANFPNPVVTP